MRLLLICLLYLPIGLCAQQLNSTELQNNADSLKEECQTPEPNYEDALRRMQKLQPEIEAQRNGRAAAATIVVRVVVHRLSSSTGLEGPTDATIVTAVEKARAEYDAGDICFSLDYINYVNLDTVLTATPDNYKYFTSTFFYPNYGDPDRMDVFVFPTEDSIGGASGAIPNDYFMIGELRLDPYWVTFSHEMGHALGLFHTHNGNSMICPSSPREFIDGSNCSTAGDFICDTPADPKLNFANRLDTLNCIFIGTSLEDCNGDSPYDPLVNNIMSYAGASCRAVFTGGQFDVMRAEILTGTTGPLVGEIAPLTLGINSGAVTGGEHHRTALETITTAVNATITISNNAKVYHSAGQKIILGKGFEAKPNNNGGYTGKVGDPCN